MLKIKRMTAIIVSIAIFLSFAIVADANGGGKIKFVVFDNCIKMYAENPDDIDFSLDINIQYNKDAIKIKKDSSDKYLGSDTSKVLKYLNNAPLEYSSDLYYSQLANISQNGKILFGMYIYLSMLDDFSSAENDIDIDYFHIATFYYSFNEGFNKTDIELSATCSQYDCYIVDSESDSGVSAEGIYDNFEWKFYNANGLLKLEESEITLNKYYCTWNAFADKITNIQFPSGITHIDSGYFENCKIKEITIPKTVKTISSNAFANCTELGSVNFEADSVIESIEASAFSNCRITSITFPDTLNYIGEQAFYDCPIKDVVIPASVEFIGSSAFGNETENIIVEKNNHFYQSVDGVVYSKDMTKIIIYPAGKNNSHFIIPDGVVTICSDAFCDADFTTVYIPNSVKSIDWRAFSNCSITAIEIPDTVCEISAQAFYSCEDLRKVKISENVTEIWPGTFMNCTALSEVKLSESTTDIYATAFAGCTSLKKITIPTSIKGISPIAFSYCSSLSDIYFLGTEEQWKKIYKAYEDEWMLDYPPMSEDVNIHYHIKHEYKTEILVPAECNKQGEILFNCECGKSYIEQSVALGHNWSNWTIKVQATYEKEGLEERICTVCKSSEKRVIDKLINKTELTFNDNVAVLDDDAVFVSQGKTLKEIIKNLSEDVNITDKNSKAVDINNIAASGMVITLKDKTGKTTDSVIVIVACDNDGDGKATAADARTALRASVKLDSLNEWQMKASNVDDVKKGDITAADARYILRASVGLENPRELIKAYK